MLNVRAPRSSLRAQPVQRLPEFLSRLLSGANVRQSTVRAGETRVLVAATELAKPHLDGVLADLPVEFVSSIEEGVDALGRKSYSHVVVGYLFAESRMFEFAGQVRRLQPSARILCVKGAGRVLGPEFRAGLNSAVRELGCEGFYDLTAQEAGCGFDGTFDELLGNFRDALDSMPAEKRKIVAVELRKAMQRIRAALDGGGYSAKP